MAAAMHGLAASDIRTVPGWYGKLPSLGDFASRRLDADFIEPWDLWLGERLQSLRDSRGDAWLDAYLHSPPWRFLLTPGVLAGREGTRVLAGVLLSSVDRVGRYFPLTVVAALPRVPTSAQDVDALLAWMQRVEDAALDALQLEWDIETLEAALARLAPPAADAAGPDDPLAVARQHLAAALARGGGEPVELAPAASRQDLASVIAGGMNPVAPGLPSTTAAPTLGGIGLWLSQRPERQRILVTRGLPAQHEFFVMFGTGIGTEPSQAHAAPQTALIPEDADLLGMFDAPAPATPQTQAPSAHDDVLALFAAPAAPANEKPDGEETRPGDHDILALFDALPAAETGPAGEIGKPSDPDILDLFGAKPRDDAKSS